LFTSCSLNTSSPVLLSAALRGKIHSQIKKAAACSGGGLFFAEDLRPALPD
jgi:hypothetical protein